MQQTSKNHNQSQLLDFINGEMVLRWLPDGTIISANSILCEFLGYSSMDLCGKSIFSYINELDHTFVKEYISTFTGSDSRNSIEYRITTKSGETLWLHWRDYYIYNPHAQCFEFHSIGHNFSEGTSTLMMVNRFENFDRLITKLSMNFINLEPENLDSEIQKSLQMIGEFAMVDRCYVFLYSEDGKTMNNTHEWCAPVIEPQKSFLQNLPVASLPWWHKIISNLDIIHVPSVDNLPVEASAEKAIFKKQSIRSLVVVPIEQTKKIIGFLGFDAVKYQKNWTEGDISLLKIFGSIIGRAITQVKTKNELLVRERFLQKLNEISIATMNSRNIQEMMDVVVNHLKNIIMADGCFITLWDDQKGLVIPVAASKPFSKKYKDLQIQPGEKTITEYVLEHKKYLILDDVFDSSLLSPRIAQTFSARCVLGIPLMIEESKLGAILMTYNKHHNFSQEEITLAQQAAYLVSMALSKQVALEGVKKYAQEVEILRETGMIVASTLELDVAINRILEQLEQVIPFDYATIQLVVDQQLEIRAGKGWPDPERIIGKRILIPGDNPNTWVIQNRQPVYHSDVQVDFKAFQEMQVEIHSWLGAPLIVNDELIGMITLEKRELDFYDNNHLKLASTFADQVAIFVSNAQSYKNERQRVMELNALRDTLNEISNELEVSQLLPAIIRRATALLKADGGELGLFDENTKEIRVVYSQRVGIDLTGTVLSMGEGMFGKVAETLHPMIIQNYLSWDDRLTDYDSEMVNAVIAVPLLIGKRLLGVIGIARTNSTEPFTKNDQNLLFLFAQQAAIAINNAKLYQEIETLTKVDSLTGLYNRRGFNELSHREVAFAQRSNKPMVMLMIDIDYFKFINDHHGHAIGDQILCLLATKIQKNLRETDILCRYGGEEFAILLPETDIQLARKIAQRIRLNVANKPFEVPNMELKITISIGVAWMPGRVTSIETLLKQADQAMYQAKRSGRNKVCLYDEI